jgi:hypothetical protein
MHITPLGRENYPQNSRKFCAYFALDLRIRCGFAQNPWAETGDVVIFCG